MIPLSVPNISGNELQYVRECLTSGWISTAGEFVSRFETEFAAKLGVQDAVSTMNGTAALHLALQLVGVRRADLVLMPNITFVATANAVSYLGADPIFIDIEPNSWQMDLNLLESFLSSECCTNNEEKLIHKASGRKVAGVLAVHVQGHMCDMERLLTLCTRFNVPLIEDAAEALGAEYRGKPAGTFGEVGCFSFNGNKIMSTGGGGMLVANDSSITNSARHLATTAKTDPLRYEHDEIGFNYRLVNVLAAIGVAQLEQLDHFLAAKRNIASRYETLLAGVGDITFQKSCKDVLPNDWLFTFTTKHMELLLQHLNSEGIMARPFWMPMNSLVMYRDRLYFSEKDVSAQVHAQALSIPCSTNLTAEDQLLVVDKIVEFFGGGRD